LFLMLLLCWGIRSWASHCTGPLAWRRRCIGPIPWRRGLRGRR
jgi:hypothetical protein